MARIFLTLLRWGLYTVLQFLSYTVWQASLGCVCCWFALLSAEFFWLEHVFFMATRHWIMVSYSVSWIVSNLSWHKFPASSKKEKSLWNFFCQIVISCGNKVTTKWCQADNKVMPSWQQSRNFSPICLPKPKSFEFLKKSSLWMSVVRGHSHRRRNPSSMVTTLNSRLNTQKWPARFYCRD